MKTFLIIVLIFALLSAAVFTRPSGASFRDYLTGDTPRTAPSLSLPGPAGGPMTDSDARRFLDGCTVADRILWVEVTRDGRMLYAGAFGHWFAHAAPAPPEIGRVASNAAK